MKITALVENTTIREGLSAQHGLSLFVETDKHTILVDMGANDAFLHNARALGIDIGQVDVAIVTHGHSDHGGGLRAFLEANDHAKVYIQRSAFDDHYVKVAGFFKARIGLDKTLIDNPRVVLVDGDFEIDDQIRLLTNPTSTYPLPKFNGKLLKKRSGKFLLDDFLHEQSVLIVADSTVLIGGCAHRGIANIIAQADNIRPIDLCVSGFHLYNPASKATEDAQSITALSALLKKYKTRFVTCHCTGAVAYQILKEQMGDQIWTLSTGEECEI